VDVVIAATGYTRRYPFLHADLRRQLEEDEPLLLESPTMAAGTEDKAAASPPQRRNGLFLGTLHATQPSLAFVGHQKELLPPFLLFEAQARFICAASKWSVSHLLRARRRAWRHLEHEQP